MIINAVPRYVTIIMKVTGTSTCLACPTSLLKDKFGSLELEACVDSTGDGADCITTLCYLYVLDNIGTSDMDITELERTRDGVTENLFPL